MDILGNNIYILRIDAEYSVFEDAKSAIKLLRNTLKADVLLRPAVIGLQKAHIKDDHTIELTDIKYTDIIRGVLWTDAEYPPDFPDVIVTPPP